MVGRRESISNPSLSLRVENEIPSTETPLLKSEPTPEEGVVPVELESKLSIEGSIDSRPPHSNCTIERRAALTTGKESLDPSTKSKHAQKLPTQRDNG